MFPAQNARRHWVLCSLPTGGDGIESEAPRLAMACRAATLYLSVITLQELEKGIPLQE